MLAEEIRNLAHMARTMWTMQARIIEVLDELAEQAAQFEASAGPAETQTVGALPPGVLDLRDPQIWGRA